MRRGFVLLLLLGTGAEAAAAAVPAPADTMAAAAPLDSLWTWPAFDVPSETGARWEWRLASGFDALVHTYPLATTDTTETVTEYLAEAGLQGRSGRGGDHRWDVRAEASFGSEMVRERLEANWRRLDAERRTRLRLSGSMWGRQYRSNRGEIHSSDNLESRAELRAMPWSGEGNALEGRLWTRLQDYADPSELEISYREIGVGWNARSLGWETPVWELGVLGARRTYPDSSRIDRTTAGWRGRYGWRGDGDAELRLAGRSDRRWIEDETARPSAWIHGAELEAAVPAGSGRLLLETRTEGWLYDEEEGAYFDSWRTTGFAGWERGNLLGTRWRIGMAGERLAAGEVPETYSQFGLRGGIETWETAFSASLTLELGQRLYGKPATDESGGAGGPDAQDDGYYRYSDFTYWEVWLTAAWRISDRFTLDVMANYEPENHEISGEDSALGYATVRLAWRP